MHQSEACLNMLVQCQRSAEISTWIYPLYLRLRTKPA